VTGAASGEVMDGARVRANVGFARIDRLEKHEQGKCHEDIVEQA
jgi:hypothetical protein